MFTIQRVDLSFCAKLFAANWAYIIFLARGGFPLIFTKLDDIDVWVNSAESAWIVIRDLNNYIKYFEEHKLQCRQ